MLLPNINIAQIASLVAATIAGAGATFGVTVPQVEVGSSEPAALAAPAPLGVQLKSGVIDQSVGDARGQLLAGANAFRATQGQGLLVEDAQLNNQAQAWAEHLAGVGDLIHSDGNYAENLAITANAPVEAIQQFADSPTHRHILLDGDYGRVGHGVALVQTGHFAGQWLVVQQLYF